MSLTGTPMYMAPEVIQGGSSGATASQGGARAASLGAMDIWALGCCVVEMVTGKPPWAHLDNEWAIMYQVVQGNPRLPDASEISADGLRFIRRCFARHPADRPPADELLRDRWVAGTVRSMERLEAHGLPVGRLAAVAAAGSSAEYLDLMAAATAAADDDNDDDDSAGDEQQQQQQHLGLAHHHHRMHSIGSVSSNNNNNGNNPPGGRSRVASISRKHAPGDLRFITSATGGPSGEAMLSMMDHNRSKAAAGISAGESIVDRSPGFSGAGQPMAVGPSMSVGHTPGSPNSATSLHAAWPFNKDTAAASLRSSAHAHAAFNSSINSGGGGVDSAAAVVMSLGTPEPLSSTGEDLVAIYSSPSLIYQMLSGNNTAGSPAHSASGVGSMSTPLGHLPSALISGVM
ncbi:Suppressor of Sensor Kinase (SLN1), partial [Coemansia sp. RSA 1836]